MAAAAALSNQYFLAAAAAASSRDVNESSSATRMPSFDDHHHLTSSATVKRSLSPSFFSKSNEDHAKKFASATNPSLSFTPPINNMNSPSLLSQVSKLKIITKGNNLDQWDRSEIFIRIFSLDNHLDQSHQQHQSAEKSISLSIELNGIAYQGTLYATTITGSNKE